MRLPSGLASDPRPFEGLHHSRFVRPVQSVVPACSEQQHPDTPSECTEIYLCFGTQALLPPIRLPRNSSESRQQVGGCGTSVPRLFWRGSWMTLERWSWSNV